MNILAISGSLRRASTNTALLKAAQSAAPADIKIEIAGIDQIPLYNGDIDSQQKPDCVIDLSEKIRRADGVLIATPEYNYSVPGVLKNAIDWISRVENQPFAGKPLGIMGASPANLGTARAQYHLRQVFVYLDPRLMNRPELFVSSAHSKFDAVGGLTDEETRNRLTAYLSALKDWIAN